MLCEGHQFRQEMHRRPRGVSGKHARDIACEEKEETISQQKILDKRRLQLERKSEEKACYQETNSPTTRRRF